MQKDLNLFSVYHKPIDAQGRVDKVNLIGGILLGATFIIMVGTSVLFWSLDSASVATSANIKQYLQRADVKDAESKYDAALGKLAAVNAYKQLAGQNVEAFKSAPSLTTDFLTKLAACQPTDVSVDEISYGNNLLTLKCSSTTQSSAANFVHTIKAKGAADNVTYSGFTQNGAKYSFTINCEVRGGAGK